MFWQSNHRALQPLPNMPAAPVLEEKEYVLFYGYFYKRHPIFRNSWSARLLIFTYTRFIWADAIDDNGVDPKRQFRKNRIQYIKPAAGPQLLPGCAFTIDDKDYVFSHDDPINIDRLVNFVVNYMQIRDDFPKYQFYEPQRPVIKLGIRVPGERTGYPEVSYRSDPLFTPSQIALLQGSRIFLQGVAYVDRQLRRIVVTNEMFYIFEHYGDIIHKFAPHEVLCLKHNGKSLPINALEYNNNREISVMLADEEILLYNCNESKCQWNGAIASFLGIIPSLDCIYNVKQYAEEDQLYNYQFVEVNRQLGKVGHNKLMNDDEESSSEDYIREDEVRGLKDILTTVLINDIVEETEQYDQASKNESSKTDQVSDLVDSAMSLIGVPRQSFSDRGGPRRKQKRYKHKNRQMYQEEQYVRQVQLKINYLNERFENYSNSSMEESEEAPELDVQDLQNRMTTYSLTMLTKVLDHAAFQNDPYLNTFDLLMPYFDCQTQQSEYAELVEEAAYVRRHILLGYAKQYTCTEDLYQIYCGYIPEPFGDIFEFLEKIYAIVPPDLSPETIGVAFPQAQFISETAKFVRFELMRVYYDQLRAYGEMLALMRAFFQTEYEMRRDNDEKYLLVPPESCVAFCTASASTLQRAKTISSEEQKSAQFADAHGTPRSANAGSNAQKSLGSPISSASAQFTSATTSKYSSKSELTLEYLIPTYVQSQPIPSQLCALDIYKILIWYSEQIGQPLAVYLRKLIVYETLLSAMSDNIVVYSAAEYVLKDGELVEQDEIHEIIDEIAQLDDVQEYRFYHYLDKENSSYYGYNLHIFGANERIRRAGQILLQAVVTRLEVRCLRQFCYFITGGELVDLKFDFLEAEKYITGTDALSYSYIFVSYHRFHLNKLSLQITMDVAQYLAWMSNRLAFNSTLVDDATDKVMETSFSCNRAHWCIRGEYAAAKADGITTFFKRRDFVVERVSGSRPDEQLPEKYFLLWMGRKLYFCKLLDGPNLQICAEFGFQKSEAKLIVSLQDQKVAVFSPGDEVWQVESEGTVFQIPAQVNPLLVIFALFVDRFDEKTTIRVTPTLYRLLTLSCPLDSQGASYRRYADNDEHGLLEWCSELSKRPVVLVENEVQACCQVFADWME